MVNPNPEVATMIPMLIELALTLGPIPLWVAAWLIMALMFAANRMRIH